MATVATIAIGTPISNVVGPARFNAPVRRRSKLSVLGWVVGFIVIGGMGVSVLLPSLCRSSETANRVKCASNLRQIGQAITLYAQENGGQYPPSLAILFKQGRLSPEALICPSSNDQRVSAADTAAIAAELEAAETNAPAHQHCLSYIYVGSRLTVKTVSEGSIVAYEPVEDHNGMGTNVLFGDEHVEFIDNKSWPKFAADSGVAVVPSLMSRP